LELVKLEFRDQNADSGISFKNEFASKMNLLRGTFTYDVRCFEGTYTYMPTLIRNFTISAYLVKSDSA
jgi:hypothetical protein